MTPSLQDLFEQCVTHPEFLANDFRDRFENRFRVVEHQDNSDTQIAFEQVTFWSRSRPPSESILWIQDCNTCYGLAYDKSEELKTALNKYLSEIES